MVKRLIYLPVLTQTRPFWTQVYVQRLWNQMEAQLQQSKEEEEPTKAYGQT